MPKGKYTTSKIADGFEVKQMPSKERSRKPLSLTDAFKDDKEQVAILPAGSVHSAKSEIYMSGFPTP